MLVSETTIVDFGIYKQQAIDDINGIRDLKINQGFNFEINSDIYKIQSRSSDRENIMGLAMIARAALVEDPTPGDYRWLDPNADFEFITEDNQLIKLDAASMIDMYNTGISFKATHTLFARAFKTAILEATTIEEVDNTVSTFIQAWPS